jgi:O-antigen/teichoic acid export membrane protein
MQRLRKVAGTDLPYVLSIALAKGVSLALMPWVAGHLPPAEYGRIEIVGSTLEFAGMIFACGLADTLFRFAGSARDDVDQKERAATIAGSSIVLALICAAFLQLLVPVLGRVLPVPVGEGALRMSLLAASVSGMIELPLAWLRLRERPMVYFAFAAVRALLQLGLIGWLVARDPRAESVLIGAASVEIAIAVVLGIAQARDTGLRVSREALGWIVTYGLPLVLGSFATFAVGACDRWFLVGHVSTADLGRYGIATKLALATALLMQPFSLWWYARRLTVLGRPGGLDRSAEAVGLGFAILLIAAAVMSMAGPAFVHLALPASYAPAVHWIPWLVAVSVLNETASLLNVGCYARRSTWSVTAINALGAGVAVAGYLQFIPGMGVDGAILATILAHAARIAGFLAAGHRSARIPYRAGSIAILAIATIACVWLSGFAEGPAAQGAVAVLGPIGLAVMAWALGLVRLEPAPVQVVVP